MSSQTSRRRSSRAGFERFKAAKRRRSRSFTSRSKTSRTSSTGSTRRTGTSGWTSTGRTGTSTGYTSSGRSTRRTSTGRTGTSTGWSSTGVQLSGYSGTGSSWSRSGSRSGRSHSGRSRKRGGKSCSTGLVVGLVVGGIALIVAAIFLILYVKGVFSPKKKPLLPKPTAIRTAQSVQTKIQPVIPPRPLKTVLAPSKSKEPPQPEGLLATAYVYAPYIIGALGLGVVYYYGFRTTSDSSGFSENLEKLKAEEAAAKRRADAASAAEKKRLDEEAVRARKRLEDGQLALEEARKARARALVAAHNARELERANAAEQSFISKIASAIDPAQAARQAEEYEPYTREGEIHTEKVGSDGKNGYDEEGKQIYGEGAYSEAGGELCTGAGKGKGNCVPRERRWFDFPESWWIQWPGRHPKSKAYIPMNYSLEMSPENQKLLQNAERVYAVTHGYVANMAVDATCLATGACVPTASLSGVADAIEGTKENPIDLTEIGNSIYDPIDVEQWAAEKLAEQSFYERVFG